MSRVLCIRLASDVSVIYLAVTSPSQSIVLPSDALQSNLGGPPSNIGIRGLSTSEVHSPHVTIRLVVSYTTFSPLPLSRRKKAVVFFYTTLPLRTTSR